MQIGRKIFYDIATGNVIVDTGERSGSVIETTPEQDIATFSALSERVRKSFDFIQLDFGQYAEDFIQCNGYRVNVETKTLEFSYPTDEEQPQEPIFQTPLTERIAVLEAEKFKLTKRVDSAENAIMAIMDMQTMMM